MHSSTFVPIFLILSSLIFSAYAQNGAGLTLDSCGQNSDCRAPRTCNTVEEATNTVVSCPSSDDKTCLCMPEKIIKCSYLEADDDPESCPFGERCTRYTSGTGDTVIYFCMSCSQAKSVNGSAFEIPDGDAATCTASDGAPSSDDTSEGGSSVGVGRNMDSCASGDNCLAPRSCVFIQDNIASTCNGESGCVCYDLTNRFACTSQAECPDSLERCARPAISDEAYKGECTSTNVIATRDDYLEIREVDRDTEDAGNLFSGDTSSNAVTKPDPDSNRNSSNSGVCVDATLLSHFHPSKLVFSAHHRAAVLCDASQSCATPGHIVEYGGKVMSMRTYCKYHTACTKRLSWVNSPKFERGLRIKSRTDNLSFTPFAARYETALEERVLRLLVAIGF